MVDKEWFKSWFDSPFYHKLYFERNEEEARQFIRQLLEHLKPTPGSRMLDVGCGRGRFSRMLADADYEVTGFDVAANSISYAKQFESNHLHFFIHDMRLPFWVNYFHYAFNFFTSFGYFHTRREHDNAMRTIAGSLKPGGRLILDYLNVHYVESHLIANEIKQVGETNYEIHRWQDEHHFYKKMIITDPELKEPAEHTEKVAKFSLGDFNDLLSYQHMQITEVFGDYKLHAYHTTQTPRLILLATKTR